MKNYKTILVLVLLVAAAGLQMLTGNSENSSGFLAPPAAKQEQTNGSSGLDTLMRAYDERRSRVWVEVAGKVKKTLADDNQGSRHQRFILQLPNQHTVLVAHNIDLADKVPLSRGDQVRIRGRYEWNDRGGVLHWTHHDPKGHIKGGWIQYGGTQYK